MNWNILIGTNEMELNHLFVENAGSTWRRATSTRAGIDLNSAGEGVALCTAVSRGVQKFIFLVNSFPERLSTLKFWSKSWAKSHRQRHDQISRYCKDLCNTVQKCNNLYWRLHPTSEKIRFRTSLLPRADGRLHLLKKRLCLAMVKFVSSFQDCGNVPYCWAHAIHMIQTSLTDFSHTQVTQMG